MEQLNQEQVALHAYFIAERRRKLGMPGDQTSDWVQAERELLSEIKTKALIRRLDYPHPLQYPPLSQHP